MSLIKWNNGFRPTISSLVDDWFNDDFLKPIKSEWMPAANVKETDDAFMLEVAAPGMEKKDFSIKLEKGVLTVKAEKSEELDEKEEQYTRKEFSYKSFSRSFWIPENTEEDKIEASYTKGVLTVMIPKTEEIVEASGTTIEIQ